jgi:hypothetical protein
LYDLETSLELLSVSSSTIRVVFTVLVPLEEICNFVC